nr:translation initiation factor IF-2-like [Manis javanica]
MLLKNGLTAEHSKGATEAARLGSTAGPLTGRGDAGREPALPGGRGLFVGGGAPGPPERVRRPGGLALPARPLPRMRPVAGLPDAGPEAAVTGVPAGKAAWVAGRARGRRAAPRTLALLVPAPGRGRRAVGSRRSCSGSASDSRVARRIVLLGLRAPGCRPPLRLSGPRGPQPGRPRGGAARARAPHLPPGRPLHGGSGAPGPGCSGARGGARGLNAPAHVGGGPGRQRNSLAPNGARRESLFPPNFEEQNTSTELFLWPKICWIFSLPSQHQACYPVHPAILVSFFKSSPHRFLSASKSLDFTSLAKSASKISEGFGLE